MGLFRSLFLWAIAVVFTTTYNTNAAANAGVSITVKNRPFLVSGNSIGAVVRSMKRNGPFSEDHGRRAIGLADYRYRTSVTTKKKKGRCHVVSVRITMTIFYFLPTLSNSSRLSARDTSSWRRIERAIRNHEHQHGRNYRRLARELQGSIANMKPQNNCREVRKLERRIRARLEKADKSRNRNYDRATYGGINRLLKRTRR